MRNFLDFPPLGILPECWIEQVTFGFLRVMFIVPTFYRGFQDLQQIVLAVVGAMDYPCSSCMLVQLLEI